MSLMHENKIEKQNKVINFKSETYNCSSAEASQVYSYSSYMKQTPGMARKLNKLLTKVFIDT